MGWLQTPRWKVFKGSHWGAMSLTPGHLWAQGEGCRTTRETTHGCPLLRVPWSSVDVRDRRGSQAASSDVGLPPLTAGAMQRSHTIAGSKAKGPWGGCRVYFCPLSVVPAAWGSARARDEEPVAMPITCSVWDAASRYELLSSLDGLTGDEHSCFLGGWGHPTPFAFSKL